MDSHLTAVDRLSFNQIAKFSDFIEEAMRDKKMVAHIHSSPNTIRGKVSEFYDHLIMILYQITFRESINQLLGTSASIKATNLFIYNVSQENQQKYLLLLLTNFIAYKYRYRR